MIVLPNLKFYICLFIKIIAEHKKTGEKLRVMYHCLIVKYYTNDRFATAIFDT